MRRNSSSRTNGPIRPIDIRPAGGYSKDVAPIFVARRGHDALHVGRQVRGGPPGKAPGVFFFGVHMKNKTLVMMVGLPRSGKTTAAQTLSSPIVSPDAIRISLHGRRFYAETEAFVWALARVMVASLFRAGHDRVILDACNHTRKRRQEWKSDLWSRSYVVTGTKKETCMATARESGDEEIMPIIAQMAADFEPVQADEWDATNEH